MAQLIFSLFTIVLLSHACQGDDEIMEQLARFGERNLYYLYTRDDPRQPIRVEPTVVTVNAIRVWKPKTDIIIHDVQGSFATSLNPTVKDALLTAEDVNVIIVDWSDVAGRGYDNAVEAAPQVGAGIANLISVLVQTRKVSLDELHLIGFGVGAHIAAFAAREFTTSKIARITALDPAANMRSNNINRLRASDAKYVEVIHTNSGDSGLPDPVGHVDFYPSGGYTQTGCEVIDNQCHHNRAWELFAASLTNGNLEGNKCSTSSDYQATNCKGYTLQLGTNQLVKYGEGSYFVDVSDKYPYYSELNCVATCLD